MLGKIIENLNDIVTVWEIGGEEDLNDLNNKMVCTKMNKVIEKHTGKPAEYYLGKSLKDCFPNAIKSRELMRSYRKAFLNNGESDIEFRSDDRLFKIRMFYLKHNSICVLTSSQDERIRAEQEAHRLNQAKSYFLANVSHEIRTPLNGVIGMIELLCDTELSDQQQEYTEMIKESGYSLMAIINDILDFSKLEAKQMVISYEPFYLRECIEAAFDIINLKASEKNLALTYIIDPDVPSYIKSDFNRLKQILINLLSNAVKFTIEGSVTLSVQINHGDDEDYSHSSTPTSLNSSYDSFWNSSSTSSTDTDSTDVIELLFKVKDTGVGISDDDLIRIFDSFQQVHQSRSQMMVGALNSGTGLGLSIARRLVGLLEGDIRINSKIGVGSTFSFTIITEYIEPDSDDDTVSTKLLEGLSIMIVDDNEVNRVMLCTTLLKWGVLPIPCSTVDEALAYVRKNFKFDLALIDIRMPKMDGFTFAKKIEAIRPDLPMIALSSIDRRYDSVNPFKLFLTKPIKERHLFNSCASTIGYHATNSKTTHACVKSTPCIDCPVLVAEDVYINQKVIVGHLSNLGFTNIDVANNGRETLNLMHESPYRIVFLDIKMPLMSGVHVIRKLREDNVRLPHIVAVTADVSPAAKRYYLEECGMNDYLSKPVSLKDIKRVVQKFLSKEKKCKKII